MAGHRNRLPFPFSHILLWVGLFGLIFKLCSSYSVCTFTPLSTCFTAHLLTGTKIVWDKHWRSECLWTETKLIPFRKLATLHYHKTEVFTFKSWLLKARRNSHKHKAHNTEPKIHKYLKWAGQCTHHGGEQHSWAAWQSFAQEMLSPEQIKEISWHGNLSFWLVAASSGGKGEPQRGRKSRGLWL